MSFSVWLFIAIVIVLFGVLSIAIRFSLKLAIAAVVLVFVALSLSSIATDNDLLWGLDSFPVDTPSPAGMSVVETIAYVSMLGSVGLLWFRAFLVRNIDSQSHRIALAFSIIAVAAHALLVGYIQLWELRDAGDTTATLFSARTWDVDSQASSIRAVICLLLGLPIQHWYARKDPNVERNRWFVLTGGLVALGSLTVVGHTAYQPPTWLSHGMDFLHGVGASLWFGGLIGLALFLRSAFRTREDAVRTAQVLTSFSSMAMYSVLMLAVSGGVMAFMIKDDVTNPTESDFAKSLSLKLLLVLIPIGIAAYNRFRLMPQIKADPESDTAWATIRKTTLLEIVVIIAILVVTGVLVLASPVLT